MCEPPAGAPVAHRDDLGHDGDGDLVRRNGAEVEAGADKFRLRRIDWALALLLVVAAAGLRFYHLSQPNELVFDEVYFVEQGKNYLRGKEFIADVQEDPQLQRALFDALTRAGLRMEDVPSYAFLAGKVPQPVDAATEDTLDKNG